MAERENIVRGLESVVSEARRLASLFSESQWERRAPGGWTAKQIFAHLAATAEVVPQFATILSQTPAGTNLRASVDVDAMNAQAVAAREGRTPGELAEAVVRGYEGLVAFVRNAPQALLDARAQFGPEPAALPDIMATNVVLHALHHLYEAATAA